MIYITYHWIIFRFTYLKNRYTFSPLFTAVFDPKIG